MVCRNLHLIDKSHGKLHSKPIIPEHMPSIVHSYLLLCLELRVPIAPFIHPRCGYLSNPKLLGVRTMFGAHFLSPVPSPGLAHGRLSIEVDKVST